MIRTIDSDEPRIHPDAFVHDSAEVIGRVDIKAQASVWPMCVLRGDLERIVVGERSNIQDLTAIHTSRGFPTIIGRRVTVGHRAVLHGARIGDGALIGMGAVVMEARIGAGAIVAAGALVPAGSQVPAGSLAIGVPARIVRKVSAKEKLRLREIEATYSRHIRQHRRTSRVVFP
ncbi:MAG: gamma carbonic anhydrase family protein [Elusimicrobiota bacterium]